MEKNKSKPEENDEEYESGTAMPKKEVMEILGDLLMQKLKVKAEGQNYHDDTLLSADLCYEGKDDSMVEVTLRTEIIENEASDLFAQITIKRMVKKPKVEAKP